MATKTKAAKATLTDLTGAAELSADQIGQIRTEITDRRESIDQTYWELASLLHVVFEKTLYINYGFEDWPSYVDGELGMKPRRAQYLIGIADWFGKMDDEIQTWIKGLGWSKAKELVGRVDGSNWKEWREKIDGMTVSQLVDYLKGVKKGGSNEPPEKTEEQTKRLAFRVYEDQAETIGKAVNAAKESLDTDHDAVALTAICTEYLANGGGSIDDVLSRVEKMLGVQLIAVKGGACLYGYDVIETLGEGLDDEDEIDEDEDDIDGSDGEE